MYTLLHESGTLTQPGQASRAPVENASFRASSGPSCWEKHVATAVAGHLLEWSYENST